MFKVAGKFVLQLLDVINILSGAYKRNRNVAWLVMLSVTAAISQFVVYRAILINGGAEAMGVWALFAALAAFAQVTSLGFAPALLRQVPLQLVNGKRRKVALLLATVNFSNLFVVVPLTFALYFPSVWYGRQMLSGEALANYNSILPVGLSALALNNLSAAYLNVIDGFSYFAKRAIIQSLSYLIFVIVALLELRFFGVIGVAYAFLCQHIFILVCVTISVKSLIRIKSFFPLRWNKWSFYQLFGYTVKLQLSNVLALLFDPLVKYYITKYVGLSGTATYEVANKAVMQGRNLVAVASQVITPEVVKMQIDGELSGYYKQVFKKASSISFLLSLIWLGSSPLLSYLFMGTVIGDVVAVIIVMNIGWYVNMIGLPSYYFLIGSNKLSQIVIVHLFSILLLGVLFYFFGSLVTPMGVGIIPAISLGFSAVFSLFAANRFLGVGVLANGRWIWMALFLAGLSIAYWFAVFKMMIGFWPMLFLYFASLSAFCFFMWYSGRLRAFMR